MALKDLTDKVKENADNIGALIGALHMGTGPLYSVADRLMKGQIHVPDFPASFGQLVRDKNMKSLAMASLGLYICREMGVPFIGPLATPVIKFTGGYAGGMVATKLAVSATHSEVTHSESLSPSNALPVNLYN